MPVNANYPRKPIDLQLRDIPPRIKPPVVGIALIVAFVTLAFVAIAIIF